MSPAELTEQPTVSNGTLRANHLKAQTVALGIDPNALPIPRPDLSGARLKSPTAPEVYLVDPSGYLRWVPNPDTYDNLFRDWNGITISTGLDAIARGSDITSGAVLSKGSNSDQVYLISNGIRRWITSPAVMDKYYFNWNKIVVVPQVVIDSIPQGENWT
jgi:hypothetical protein